MTKAAIRNLFTPGQRVTVTNHYITREDHPCFGTRVRMVARVTTSHLHFAESGSVAWPKASQMTADGGTVRLFGGGVGQAADAPFLTIQL